MKANSPVVLLTDFGTADGYVAAMRGAILTISQETGIFDISHHIPHHDINHGAYVLSFTYANFPKGTVFCVVIDPGVGSSRKAIVMASKNYLFVGPDNGVLWPAARADGHVKVYELPVPATSSTTFHGRDVFAPAAARLALGQLALQELKELSHWEQLDFGHPQQLDDGKWQGAIQTVDHFGNVITNFKKEEWAAKIGNKAFTLKVGKATISKLYQCYDEAQGEETFCIWGSGGYLEISKRQASAASAIGLQRRKAWPGVLLSLS